MKKRLLKIIAAVLVVCSTVPLISCSGLFESAPIKSIKINGVSIKKFKVLVPFMYGYDLPVTSIQRYFDKYCNVKMFCTDAPIEIDGPKIVLGGKKADGSDYEQFETEIYFKDGDLHLGCANHTTAQRVIYAFFDKYLSEPGKADIEIPDDGTSVYYTNEPDWDEANPEILTIQDKIVRGCYKLQDILEYDHAHGNYYTYENSGYPDTIEEARATNNRTTNCVIVGNWVMKDAGFYETGIYNHTYDGTTGYSFSKESKPFFEENFEVIDMRDKEVSIGKLQEEGKVYPGDIIGFNSHNQMILPNKKAFDGGRGQNTEVAARGAKFIQWVGDNPYPDMTVGFIIRSKDADSWD